jgi:hypothetical protein
MIPDPSVDGIRCNVGGMRLILLPWRSTILTGAILIGAILVRVSTGNRRPRWFSRLVVG